MTRVVSLSPTRPEDIASIDSILAALYQSISFAGGEGPDYKRLGTLFVSGARIIPPQADDSAHARVFELDEFFERSREFLRGSELEQRGFVQSEKARTVEAFGRIAHVFSTYESRFPDDDQPFERGIYSIQLLKQLERWWLVSVVWEVERKDLTIPEVYLGGG